MGYGGYSENKSFMIRISNIHGGPNDSGFGDGSYSLGVAGYANDKWTTTLKISPNVETTFAISLDGVGDGTNSIAHFFLKGPITGNWQMETVVLTNGQYNTELGEGFMIGGYPSSSTSVRHAYNGTIGQIGVYNSACTSINDIVLKNRGIEDPILGDLRGKLKSISSLSEALTPFIPEKITIGGMWESASGGKSGRALGVANTGSILTKFKIYDGELDESDVWNLYNNNESVPKDLVLPHTFTNNYLDYISITPFTFGAGMTYELNVSIKNLKDYNGFLIYFGDSGKASTNIPGDYDNSHYIQVRNGNLLFRLAPKADNSEGQHNLSVNISNWDLFMKPDGTHIVVSISSDGYTMIVYVNGVLCDGIDGNTTVNTSTIQASGGKYEQRIPKQIILGGDGKAEIPSTEINFGDIQNLSVEEAQTSLTSNFSNISPQFLVNGATATSSNSKYNDSVSASVSANTALFSYDATGTTFNGNTTIDLSSQFDVDSAGILGNASRTIIATIKTTSSTASNRQYICGYGNWGQNYEIFAILIRNQTDYGGNDSDQYALGLGGWYNDFYSSFKITANVETTIAVSYNSENNTVYFFKKEGNSTTWTMDAGSPATFDGNDQFLLLILH